MPQGRKNSGLTREFIESALATNGSLRAVARAYRISPGSILRRAAELNVRSANPGGATSTISDERFLAVLATSATRTEAAKTLNLARSSLYSRIASMRKHGFL